MASDADFTWIYGGFTARWEAGDHHPTLWDENPTHNGVTQRTWDALAPLHGWRVASVFDLSDNEVAQVYRVIWTQSHAVDLARVLAGAHFDFSVNTSGPRANQTLQRAIGGIDVDGVIGPQTLTMAGVGNPTVMAKRYMGLRELEYHELVEANTALAPDLPGWLNRCTALRNYLGLT